MLAITNAQYREPFKIHLVFNNGYQGEVDMQAVIEQDVRRRFQPLRDPVYFSNFTLAHDTLCWPNELDFAPEFLFFQAFKHDPRWQSQFIEWGYLSEAVKHEMD